MQTEELGILLEKLCAFNFHTTIETNGTIYDPKISKWTNLVSISPKLSSSTPWEANLKDTDVKFNQKWAERHERDRKNIQAIQSYIDDCYEKPFPMSSDIELDWRCSRKPHKDFQLKFVISSLEDIIEIEEDFLAHLKGVEPTDVCLMPEGVTVEDLMAKSAWVVSEAIARGWRFTPRLHALLWGVKVGV
jgi:7-carboxy-7-deazaguanine synthase